MRTASGHLVRAVVLAGGLMTAGAAPALALADPGLPVDPGELAPDVLGGEEPPQPISVCDNTIEIGDETERMPCVAPDPGGLLEQ